ncbi:MAG: hypothetical protein J7M12_04980, partial [Candidatus Hydrogenedentes bacterium]|nr:hypothetical protein [Candidatus Hydrogenedentota bacterium]
CYAWGPNASEAIALAALQTIRRDFPDALVGSEKELFAGARISNEKMMDSFVYAGNVAAPAIVVNREMNMLRDVARIQVTEYFAYRFGVLAKITADSLVPFGLPKNAAEKAIKAKFEADIDARLKSLRYQFEDRRIVTSPTLYFQERSQFLDVGRAYISKEYQSGKGYGDYCRRAVPEYYRTAITAVADVWFTILKDVKTKRIVKQKFLPPPPKSIRLHSPKKVLVNYFVDEIIYFLSDEEKRDLVDESYSFFSQYNRDPAMAEPYDRLGDAFLAAGQGPRAVSEYRKGLKVKPTWNELRNKIIRYYLTVGQEQLDARNLEDALATYNSLLEVDPANELGNRRKTDTINEIKARDKRKSHAEELIAKGSAIVRQANELEAAGKFLAAIEQYKNAIALFESVTEEFPKIRTEAEDLVSDTENKIGNIFETAIAKAEEIIAQCEQRETQSNWKGAIDGYDQVPRALSLFDSKQYSTEKAYADYYTSAEEIKAKAAQKKAAAEAALKQQLEAQQQSPQ